MQNNEIGFLTKNKHKNLLKKKKITDLSVRAKIGVYFREYCLIFKEQQTGEYLQGISSSFGKVLLDMTTNAYVAK